MSKYDTMSGREILKEAEHDIRRLGVGMSLMAEYDHLPVEHRARVRVDSVAQIRAIREEARKAVESWSSIAHDDALRRLSVRPVGTPAEESRRVANEMRITRLVSEARAKGNTDQEAGKLAEKANAAYTLGDLDEADVLARASQSLGGPKLADDVVGLVMYDRAAADPTRAKAMHDLGDAAVVIAAFDRDIDAATSMAMMDSAKLARALGDNAASARDRGAASEASRNAKVAAALESKPFGGTNDYSEPIGVLSGVPTNIGGAPDGARLPESRS